MAAPAAPAFMYVRVKRRRATVFLRVDRAETAAAVKARVAELLQQPADDLRLLKDATPLADATTLADAGVGNDACLAAVFRDAGAPGGWEPADVAEFDLGGGGGGDE